ncbi:MAG TPA: hypothetical protein DCR97_06845 [Deltaproteobacteria bacterium]|nr:hypothetical protein [Deltaproteobacteria bacterium]
MKIEFLKRIVLSILAVIVLIGGGCATTGTPRESLSQLRSALLNHDAETALRYIDVDSITDHLVDDILNGYGTSDEALTSLGIGVGRNLQPLLLPLVTEAIRKQLRKAISSTEDNPYFGSIRKAHIFYLNVTVEEDGRAFVEPKGKSDFAFRMAKTGEGYWKIVQLIPNKNEKK